VSAPTPWQRRRAEVTADLARLGVPWRMEVGFWVVTTRDGEEQEFCTISHVEWYIRGLDDGAARVAASIPAMDVR
jgi:hypothetical protein